jgi:FKBP-type peptidyl-prolyl cis-trans isomerase 2
MALQKNDFIQIEFTAKTKDGEVFDSNVKEVLEKMNSNSSQKPFTFALGQGMFLKAVDDFLTGKELGKYNIEIPCENAFGKRQASLIQLIPIKIFHEHKLNPIPGFMFNFDGKIAKVLSASGGRVRVDFNNPVAGKDVIYEINILNKVEDKKEQISALNEFLFRKNFDFEIQDKKLVMNVEKPLAKFVELFKDKFKDILDLDLEVKEIEVKKEATNQ